MTQNPSTVLVKLFLYLLYNCYGNHVCMIKVFEKFFKNWLKKFDLVLVFDVLALGYYSEAIFCVVLLLNYVIKNMIII